MTRRRARLTFGILLFLTDATMMGLAFYLAYRLRLLTEYKRIFHDKRQRIGPIYGQLHYFPGG